VAERISRMANTPDLGSAAAITRETQQRLVRMVEAPDSSNSRGVSTLLSSAYAARVIAALRPNITFNPDSISGNPAVDIEVFLASDGTIRNTTIVRSSGSPSWDSAALKALYKTERLPKDENGQIPADLTITMRPREF
jgi:colicin import membrane protein